MRIAQKTVLLWTLGLSLVGCVNPNEIKELKANQEKILAKLEEIEKKAGQGMPQRPPMPAMPDPSKVYAFDVGKSAAKGPADAWVTIVVVSDFQCPFCGRVVPTLKNLEQKYGSDLRVVFKHNPLSFHPRAMPAAMAAECAKEQGKFWEVHDKMFANQQALEDANLEAYAKESGVDLAKWKNCMKDGTHRNEIAADLQTATTLGARGTPAFFINGRFLSGAQPQPRFEELVDEELRKAKASGVDKKDYYATVVVGKGEKKL
jgi:protein-disulfide isomerase